YLAVEKDLGLPRDRTNVDGGAIAVGHPLAASGARITAHLLYEMRRRGVRRGIGSACIGGGQGIALLLETAKDRSACASRTSSTTGTARRSWGNSRTWRCWTRPFATASRALPPWIRLSRRRSRFFTCSTSSESRSSTSAFPAQARTSARR